MLQVHAWPEPCIGRWLVLGTTSILGRKLGAKEVGLLFSKVNLAIHLFVFDWARMGLGWARLGPTGLDRARVGSTGPDLTRLGSVGLGWARLGSTFGLGSVRQDSKGLDLGSHGLWGSSCTIQ